MTPEQVTALIVNWRTLDLTQTCAEGLLAQYPDLQLVVIDNGSNDASTDYIASLARRMSNVSAILNQSNLVDEGVYPLPPIGVRTGIQNTRFGPRDVFDFGPGIQAPFFREIAAWDALSGGNVGHGPALHQMFKLCRTPYLLALDSDCVVHASGFIEGMLKSFQDEAVYAVGHMVWEDENTVRRMKVSEIVKATCCPHIHVSIAVWDVEKYFDLLPYCMYGTPGVLNMPDVPVKGYKIVDYDIGTAVQHLFEGSRKRYHIIPHLRSLPVMPRVYLRYLKSEFVGDYFDAG